MSDPKEGMTRECYSNTSLLLPLVAQRMIRVDAGAEPGAGTPAFSRCADPVLIDVSNMSNEKLYQLGFDADTHC